MRKIIAETGTEFEKIVLEDGGLFLSELIRMVLIPIQFLTLTEISKVTAWYRSDITMKIQIQL